MLQSLAIQSTTNLAECSSKSSKKLRPFPVILHHILSDTRSQDIITYLPHGCSWILVDKARFINEIIPKYFNHTKFKSFLRQVNGWGFIRITKGADRGSYYHKLFLRGKPELAQSISRPAKFRAILGNANDPPRFETQIDLGDVSQPKCESEGLKLIADSNPVSPDSGSNVHPQTLHLNPGLRTMDTAQVANLSQSLSPNAMLCNLIEHRQRQIVALICLEENRKLFRSPQRMPSNLFQQFSLANPLSLKQNTPNDRVVFL